MTAQEELTMLEAAYTSIMQGGAVQAYTINDRSVTKADLKWMSSRMDLLRRQVARQSPAGTASVAQFVEPE
jgi:hypothetical protein